MNIKINAVAPAEASKKLIKQWSACFEVGIWGEQEFTIRLYADRAIYKGMGIKWRGNNGNMKSFAHRITGEIHKTLLALEEAEIEDDADYEDDAFYIASTYLGHQ